MGGWCETHVARSHSQVIIARPCVDSVRWIFIIYIQQLLLIENLLNHTSEEIENRIGAASKVIGAMRTEVLERRELSKGTKLRVFNAMVVPTLLYGCETWTIQKLHVSRLQVAEMRYLRRVEGVTKLDKVRNEDIRQRLNQEAVVEVARKKQRAWKEKLDGMEGERLVRHVYSEEVTGRRPRGRPRKRWMDHFN